MKSIIVSVGRNLEQGTRRILCVHPSIDVKIEELYPRPVSPHTLIVTEDIRMKIVCTNNISVGFSPENIERSTANENIKVYASWKAVGLIDIYVNDTDYF